MKQRLSTYPLFVLLSAITIASPGPGLALTLAAAASLDVPETASTILGIAFGSLIVAAVSGSGLGALLAFSPAAFAAIKFAGVAYLLYLGVRLWRTDPAVIVAADVRPARVGRQFARGAGLQLVNPNALLFFVLVFPQFLDLHEAYLPQFAQLAISYGILVLAIHATYALFARILVRRGRFAAHHRHANRIAGAALAAFGAALAFT